MQRGEAVRLALLAAISGEHILLIGKPGTAKSLLARKLRMAFRDSEYFERMLTRFSVPEELFGPLSIKALEEDRYLRLTRHYLPEANIAFIDEIFKANSAILNALLTLLNEREFDNGSERHPVPLISVIAASNELPEDDSLEALYDRFLLRFHVEPVSEDAFDDFISLSLSCETSENKKRFNALSLNDIENIQSTAGKVGLSESARQLIHGLRQFLSTQDIYISDRRWQKALKVLQVSASTHQQAEVSQWDCLLLCHMLWHTPEQRVDVESWLYRYLKLDIEKDIQRLDRLVNTWEKQLEADAEKHTQKTSANGEYLYESPEGEVTTQHERVILAERNGETLYLAPPDCDDRTNQGQGYTLEQLEQHFFDASYKQTHIDGRWVDVQNYINNTQNRLVQRIAFSPLVEAFYFSSQYVENQQQELNNLLAEVNTLTASYTQLQQQLEEITHEHLWLVSHSLKQRRDALMACVPSLIDFQQRLEACLVKSGQLSVAAEGGPHAAAEVGNDTKGQVLP